MATTQQEVIQKFMAVTVKLGKVVGDATVERNYSSLSNYEKDLWHRMYSYWIKNGLNLVTKSYGSNYSFTNSAVTKTMYVVFANESSGNSAATYGGTQYAQKFTNPLKFHINFYYYSNATGVNGEQSSNNPAHAEQIYLDRTIAHELTYAAMRAHVDYYD